MDDAGEIHAFAGSLRREGSSVWSAASNVFSASMSREDGDEEQALRWAALEKAADLRPREDGSAGHARGRAPGGQRAEAQPAGAARAAAAPRLGRRRSPAVPVQLQGPRGPVRNKPWMDSISTNILQMQIPIHV
jgi:hypothetical protein